MGKEGPGIRNDCAPLPRHKLIGLDVEDAERDETEDNDREAVHKDYICALRVSKKARW